MSTDQIKSTVMTITPEAAEAILQKNPLNRPLRPKVVERYAADMAAGDWVVNGEAIKVDKDGNLVDGQHRLHGCVKAGVPFDTFVIRGLTFEARETVDTGTKRSFSDVLKFRGEKSTTGLAAGVECAMMWERNGVPIHNGPSYSNTMRCTWLDNNPDIRDAVKAVHGFTRPPLRIPMSAISAFYFRANRIDPDLAAEFMKSLRTGANLDENDPINSLRRWVTKAASTKGNYPREEYAAVLVKAWNFWLQGRTVRALVWRRVGHNAEPFPVMRDLEGRSYEEVIAKHDEEGLV